MKAHKEHKILLVLPQEVDLPEQLPDEESFLEVADIWTQFNIAFMPNSMNALFDLLLQNSCSNLVILHEPSAFCNTHNLNEGFICIIGFLSSLHHTSFLISESIEDRLISKVLNSTLNYIYECKGLNCV